MKTCIDCGYTGPEENFRKCGFCSDTGKPKRRPRCNDCDAKFRAENRKKAEHPPPFVYSDLAVVWLTRAL